MDPNYKLNVLAAINEIHNLKKGANELYPTYLHRYHDICRRAGFQSVAGKVAILPFDMIHYQLNNRLKDRYIALGNGIGGYQDLKILFSPAEFDELVQQLSDFDLGLQSMTDKPSPADPSAMDIS